MAESVSSARNAATIRKAAILVSTLDTKTADELLDRMSPEQQAQVRQAVMELQEIGSSEQDHVIREFIGSGSGNSADDSDPGVELDASLAHKLRAPELYEASVRSAVKPPPFQALCDASPEAIARQLERQHPQVAAVVVAHLPPRQAAALVQRLGPRMQSDVLRRVAELDQADPEVVREIEEELMQLLSGEIRAARNRHVGLSNVSAILEAAGNDRESLLKNVSQHDREFADLLGPQVTLQRVAHSKPSAVESERPHSPVATAGLPSTVRRDRHAVASPVSRAQRSESYRTVNVTNDKTELVWTEPVTDKKTPASTEAKMLFDELAHLNDQGWAVLIRTIDPQVFLLALAGASDAFVNRFMNQLPPRDSKLLRQRLEQIGPIRLDDIDRAQQHIAQRAVELAEQQKIQIPQPRSFAAAA